MADAAQLKLQVGLDLAFFRQQLALLGTTATSYSLPINIDRLGIQKEITKLGKNISGRKYTLKIDTTVKSAAADIDNLQKALESLEKQSVNVQITGTGNLDAKEARKIRTALRKSILANGGKIKIPATILAAITKDDVTAFTRAAQAKLSEVALNVRADITGSADGPDTKEVRRIRVALHNAILSNGGKIKIPATVVPKIGGEEVTAFRKAVDSKFAGITIKVRAELEKGGVPGFAQGPHGDAALYEYLRTQGLSGGNVADVGRSERLRKQLEQQRVTQLRGLAKEEGLTGYSKLTKNPLIDKLVQELTSETAERILGNVQNMLRNAGGGGSGGAIGKMLDTFARGVFHMLGMDPASMMAAQRQKLLPPAINWQSSAATPPQYQSKPGTMLAGAPVPTLIGGTPGPFGLLPRTTRAGSRDDMMRMLSQGAGEEQPGALAKTTKARIDEIINKYLRIVEAQIKQVFDAPVALKKQLNRFSYLVQSLRDAETRTKQMQVPIPMAIGGTAFGSQKLLPSALGNETIKILRDAAHAFLNVMRQEMRAVVYQVGVQDLGNRIGKQAMLPGRTQGPLMLPAAGGTTPRSQMPLHSVSTSSNLNIPFIAPEIGESRKITRGVGAAGAGPGIAGRGMAPPSFQKGFGSQEALAIENAVKQKLRLGLATDIAQRSLGKMNASQIPFIGGLRGVTGELGQATKQVLLYGTAYRALAAITSIPGQLLNAAKSQQQYTNGLKVATEETGTFGKELLFVDNVQRAFGLNLETTRTGFTRLYASMAPTGFDSGSIEKLFTGISAATAALQLTPDKAERVIYAFGQMASKGQIMSEELKGQLGDVLPGALAIFAKSAGMSVKEFSKAMEDGEFVGNRFREVFAKVSDELMTRFGTGAQAASKSLQGLLSTVGGDFQRTLESFAPLADSAAQAILVPLGGALRQLSTSAQIATGEIGRVFMQLKESRQELKDVKDSAGADGVITAEEARQIKAAEQNVGALTLRYKALQKAASDPAIAKQAKDIQLFTQELAKAGTFIMNVARTIGGVLSPVINFLGTNLTAVIATITSLYIGFQTARLGAMALMGGLVLLRGISTALGLGAAAQQATALSGAFNVLGVSASRANIALIGTGFAMKALLAATVVGAAVAVILTIASAFGTMRDRAKEAAEESTRAIEEGGRAASTGMTMGVTTQLNKELAKNRAVTRAIATLQRIYDRNKGKPVGTEPIITAEEMARLDAAKDYSNEIAGMISGNQSVGRNFRISAFQNPDLARAKQQAGQISAETRKSSTILKAQQKQAQEEAKMLGLNKPDTTLLDEEEKNKKKANLESYYSLQDTLAKNAANFAAAQTEEGSNRRIELLELYYDIQETRANAYQRDAIRFEREMVMIEAKRQQARLKAELDVQRNQSSVADGAPGAAKLPSSISGRLDASGQNGADMPVGSNNTIQSYHNGLVKALGTAGNNGNYIVIDFIDDLGNRLEATYSHIAAAVKVGQSVVGGQTIGRFDASGRTTGPHNSIDINSPGNSGSLQRGRETSAAQRSADILVAGNVQGQVSGLVKTAPAKVTGNEKRDAVATQKTLQASIAQTAINRAEDAKAAQEQIVAFEKYRAAAFPTIEQDVQNKLLAKRNELFKSGVTEERIDQEVKLYENQERGAAGLAAINRLQANKIITDTQATARTKELNKDIADQNNLLQQNAILTGQSKFDQAVKGLRDQIDMARAFTPEAEMRTRLQQQGYAGPELETLLETEKTKVKAEELKSQMQGVASTIGDAFSTAFQGIINGSMSAQEALGNMFQSIGQSFVKMAMDMIAQQITMITLGFIMRALGLLGSAAGAASTPLPGSAPQMTPNAIVTPTGAFEGMFKNMAANGATFSNGIAKFATGGIVNGPTLFPFADGGAMQMGLMGEAGPEAIMPLQRGADGSLGVRAAMGGNGMGGSSSPILNMNFETSTINGVEYVSRDQLELAMAQTRRQASRDGANKGMAMTLDKIQQSPQTRRRIGM